MSLGFQSPGFDVMAAVEYDRSTARSTSFNFAGSAAICRSVADIDGRYIREHSGLACDDVDVVFGGAPCQGFSMIGKRKPGRPAQPSGHHFVRLVYGVESKFFVFENVKGLTVGQHKKFLHEIIEAFEERGYKVEKRYQVLNAAGFGVPQDRRRLFLLGARRGMPLPAYPEPTHSWGCGTNMFPEVLKTPTVWMPSAIFRSQRVRRVAGARLGPGRVRQAERLRRAPSTRAGETEARTA